MPVVVQLCVWCSEIPGPIVFLPLCGVGGQVGDVVVCGSWSSGQRQSLCEWMITYKAENACRDVWLLDADELLYTM